MLVKDKLNLIGKYVKYKNKPEDNHEYLIINWEKELKTENIEICIVQEFDFYPNKIKQLFIWQNLKEFEIIPE